MVRLGNEDCGQVESEADALVVQSSTQDLLQALANPDRVSHGENGDGQLLQRDIAVLRLGVCGHDGQHPIDGVSHELNVSGGKAHQDSADAVREEHHHRWPLRIVGDSL